MAASPVIYDHLAVLAEPIRVRVLRLLAREELGVGELTAILQLPQSTVSRHLKSLLLAGWIARRAEGATSMVRLADDLDADARALWDLVSAVEDPCAAADHARLDAVLAQRRGDSRAFFGRVGDSWSQVRQELFGAGFTLPTLLALVDPALVVADLGCGTGLVAAQLAPAVARVIAVDHEQAMLDAAATRLDGVANVELRRGDLAALPLADAEADAALCMLVLHYVESPARALAEAQRILRPGGRLVVLDMLAHDRSEYRYKMGHRHLGFSPQALAALASAAGLVVERLQPLTPDPAAQGPPLLLATLVRPG